MIKHFFLSTVACLVIIMTVNASNEIDEIFKVSTQNVVVKEFTETSVKLMSVKNKYVVKLQPNRPGKVIFSLSGIGYVSTAIYENLNFEVKITGFSGGDPVIPIFSFDDVNNGILVNKNALTFQRISGFVPVWFDQVVDSVNLEYSNSMEADFSQYLRIQDMKILPTIDISPNPEILPCTENNVMFAIDGSSSISKEERWVIGDKLLDFVRQKNLSNDLSSLCIAEFGSDLISVVEVTEKRDRVGAIQKYKRAKNSKSKFTSWTNWSVAFDEAIQRKPSLFVFITDGWSNWDSHGPSSFSAQYESLVAKANTLKSNGTRILIITSNIDGERNSKAILGQMLNHKNTVEIQGTRLSYDDDLKNVDLITLKGFTKMSEINFSSIIHCPVSQEEVVKEEQVSQ